MTNLDHLTNDVQRLTAALNEANADVALLTRLRDAETVAKRLTVELGQAQDALTAGMTAKVLAQRELKFSRFRDVKIIASYTEMSGRSALGCTYTIEYETLAYDARTRLSEFETRTANGFGALPGDLYEYIMEERPEALPAVITDLAPGDPAKAMGIYWLAVRRGHMSQ